MVSFRDCVHHEKARQIQTVRDQQKVSYSEAMKRVESGRSAAVNNMSRAVPSSQPLPPSVSQVIPPDTLLLQKESLLAFIVDVLVATKSKEKRSDVIKLVVSAAERFLGTRNFLPERLHGYMKEKQSMPEPQGVVMEGESENDNEEGDDTA